MTNLLAILTLTAILALILVLVGTCLSRRSQVPQFARIGNGRDTRYMRYTHARVQTDESDYAELRAMAEEQALARERKEEKERAKVAKKALQQARNLADERASDDCKERGS